MKTFFVDILRIFKKSLIKFSEDEGFIVASGLSFKTIFALIPISAVFVGVFSVIPYFSEYKDKVLEVIVGGLLPDVTEDVVKIFDSFVSKAGTISLIGVIGLIYISLDLFITIDNQINRAWASHTKRSYVQKLLIYWSLLTLLPFMLAGYFYYSGILGSILSPFLSIMRESYYFFVSFLLLEVFFFFIYYVVPNIKIHFWKALVVSTGVSLFWLGLKSFFSYYTKIAITNWVIYGPVAAVVFMFIWISLNWIVLLFGIELLKVWQERLYLGTSFAKKFFLYDLGLFIFILNKLKEDFYGKGIGISVEEFSYEINYESAELREIFSFFEEKRIVVGDSGVIRKYYLRRNISSITLAELEELIWKKLKIYSHSAEKELEIICNELGKYYFNRENQCLTIGDILKKVDPNFNEQA